MKRACISLTLSFVVCSAFAWFEKGHSIANEAATFGLPADSAEALRRAPAPARNEGRGTRMSKEQVDDEGLILRARAA